MSLIGKFIIAVLGDHLLELSIYSKIKRQRAYVEKIERTIKYKVSPYPEDAKVMAKWRARLMGERLKLQKLLNLYQRGYQYLSDVPEDQR